MGRLKLVWIHHIHATILSLLLISGVSLYFPYLRTMFNEWKVPLVAIHLWIAIFYIGIVLYSISKIFQYSKKRAPIKKFNIWLFTVLFFFWVSSGTVMYLQNLVPVWVRNNAVVIHDWSTWIVIPWIVLHVTGNLFNKKIPWPNWWRGRKDAPVWITENSLDRRDVIKSLVLFCLFILFGGLIKWISPILSIPKNEEKRQGYFRIYNVTNDYPRYEEKDWILTLEDTHQSKQELTMMDMRKLTWHSIVDDFHCVTGWSVRAVEMRGVYLKEVLATHFTKTPMDASFTVYSGDEIYYDSFTLSQLVDENAMLIFEFDGLPLKKSQGFPCRLYHPDMYGYKSVKWVTRIKMTPQREKGYWQTNGDYELNGYL
ncbi:molybdopterin-dependent oxidoreductase [Virgibacillus sp. DJP39]|uniref:molybdopterin-dependent oxidoreductase n=1 Tax=Virgibacillus sp. DJP39 TaxID=3409790 RepID=UPI003BB4D146